MKTFGQYIISGLFIAYAASLVGHVHHQRILHQALRKINDHDSEILAMLQEESCDRIDSVVSRQT